MDLLRLYYTSDFFFEEYVVYLTLTYFPKIGIWMKCIISYRIYAKDTN